MTERLFERFRWIAMLATVTVLTVAGPALAATPGPAFYSGTGVSNAGNKAKVKLEVTRSKRGKVHIKIFKAIDGCFGASTEGSRAKVRNGNFAASFGGGTRTAGFTDQFSGQFSSARSASVKLHTSGWNFPSVGPPDICEATTTIEIHKL
jgi:hypothetical protein